MKIYKTITRRRALLGIFSILMVLMLVAAACGEEATPTPVPSTSTPVPATATSVPEPKEDVEEATPTPVPAISTPVPATATSVSATATSVPEPEDDVTGIRPIEDWTVENPATLEEIEAELENHRGSSFVFISWGGAYQAAQRQAFIVPFEKQFGIDVIEETIPTAAKIRAQAETGNILWHVMDWGSAGIWQFGPTGDVEELDFTIIDDRGNLEVERSPWTGGGGITWSEVVAYNTESYPDGLPDMSAYYDIDKYPGRRGWAYYADPELIFALLGENPSLLDTAEGRATLGNLTDEQMDRAYELFDQYKDQVSLFWQTGSDCPQLLISGELDMCTAWNGRIYDAAKEGAPIAVCWVCGHVLHTESFMMIKGIKEQDPDLYTLANLFIAWTGFPERNAEISKYITYGPLNIKSLPYLDAPEFDDVRDELPSSAANIQYAIIYDNKWWGENADAIYERYLGWQQEL